MNKKIQISEHTTIKQAGLHSKDFVEWLPHTWQTNLLLREIPMLPKQIELSERYYKSTEMNIHIHLGKRPEWVKGARDSVNLTERTFLSLFIFIPYNYLLHSIEELCEAGFSAITASVFVYQANTMSANSRLMHAVPLTFREEVREDTSAHTQSSMSQRISAFFFLLIHNTVVFNLISSHCVTAARFLWLWILQ